MKDRRGTDHNAPESRERRTAIKKLAVGAGALAGIGSLPDRWTNPIIEGIILPAHAQTSAVPELRPALAVTVLSGTQADDTVVVRVSGAVVPAAAGIGVDLTVQGSRDAAGTASRRKSGLLGQALTAAGDFLVRDAEAAECTEIRGYDDTDLHGAFTVRFTISCGPGIASVSATAVLSGRGEGGPKAYGVASVPEGAEEQEKQPPEPEPVEPDPISPCSLGVSNLLNEDITLIHDGTEYILPPGNSLPELTVYEEPFTLIFRVGTDSGKVLGNTATGEPRPFTDEITVDDAVCGGRYYIGADELN